MLLEAVLSENKALKSENVDLKDELFDEKSKNVDLEFQLAQMKKLIFGSKSERFVEADSDASQLNLFNTDSLEVSPPEPATETVTYKRKKKHPGRRPLPDHLEIEERIIEPDIDTTNMERAGEDVSDHLDYIPGSLKIIRIIRPKYVDKTDEQQQFHIAKPPPRALPKSTISDSLLAFVMVAKFVDHLPFYRLAQKFKREYKWAVDPKSMSHWLKLMCELLVPLYEVLKQKVRSSSYIQADESPIKVLAYRDKWTKGKAKAPPKIAKKIRQGYMWAYLAVEPGLVFYDYQPGRSAEGPTGLLQNFKGYLQCDGYRVYNCIARIFEGIILVGCWAHVRRKFYESLKSDAVRANYVLSKIKQIYKIEADIKEAGITDYNKITRIRKTKTKPILEALKAWVDKESIKVVAQSPIAVAMGYLQNQWPKLIAVLEDGRLKLDNNLVENKFRALALGRKNYMFAGSHKAAENIAMMYSFFATCKIQGVNPLVWLTQTLKAIRAHPKDQLEELLPGYQNIEDGFA